MAAKGHKTTFSFAPGAVVAISVVGILALAALGYSAQHDVRERYKMLESVRIHDRHGNILTLSPNSKQVYAIYTDAVPPRVAELLIKKEDRFFYVHPGINPFSTLRAAFRHVIGQNGGGGSTLTQQLVKNLLAHEQERTMFNKIIEFLYSLALEASATKAEILTMYSNTVFMGNQIQGLAGASELYFDKPLHELDDTKIMMLLATLSSPSLQNPWEEENGRVARNIANRLGVPFDPGLAIVTTAHTYTPPRQFELAAMGITCTAACATTLDGPLTQQLRSILHTHIERNYEAGARTGAIVVLSRPRNELIALVGTPDVHGVEAGQQINMATEPRPIGSTAKPFIYLAGFEKGLRPYTLVHDREYKFPTASGFPLYPKNYDGRYRGWVTLHAALSNSLNVPTVRVLQHVGLPQFYTFLEQRLRFTPLKPLDTYQYGIALGGLDMDPLTLAYYLSLFPGNGVLSPLTLFIDNPGHSTTIAAPMSLHATETRVAEPEFTQLVTRILHDRYSGVEQFGLAGNLHLFQKNYAVKTGTSRDYHDSWTVGYTPDLVVVVWLGNAENKPLKQITGQSGAGAIWNDTMELLFNSPYNKKTPLMFDDIRDVLIDGNLESGLAGDDVSVHQRALPDEEVIISPQADDTFLFEERMRIPLIAREAADWYVDDQFLGYGARISFSPHKPGTYHIRAELDTHEKNDIVVRVVPEQTTARP